MKKLLLFCLGFFMACTASATFQYPTNKFYYSIQNGVAVSGPQPTASAACQAMIASGNAAWAGSPVAAFISATETTCYYSYYYTNSSGQQYGNTDSEVGISKTPIVGCPPGANDVGGGYCTCPAPTVENASHDGCESSNNSCTPKAGKPQITNWTVGYVRTTDSDDFAFINAPSYAGASTCDSGCAVEVGEAVKAWRSESPTAQGTYRMSIDYQTVPTGSSCTASAADAPAQKTTPIPPCPGFVGEVNGKTVCTGTASRPIVTTPGNTAGITPKSGNPAAGEKPATGEGSGTSGSGRTPSTGDGGPAGGPAGAVGSSSGGTGNVASPGEGQEQQACGAPGQPPCRIDESGTPNGGTAFDKAKADLANAQAQRKTAIDNAAAIQAPTWSFTFQLPTGCTAYNVGIANVVIDPCQYQGTIHSLMSMIWAAVTAFCIIGMVGRTIRES